MAVKRRKRLVTRLYEAIDQLDVLLEDSAKKPSALKAVTSKAEILMTLLKREDAQKTEKAAAKAAATAPPASETAEALIAQVAELKQKREGAV
jgi:hypothetical protein